jgi:hypothetical protein
MEYQWTTTPPSQQQEHQQRLYASSSWLQQQPQQQQLLLQAYPLKRLFSDPIVQPRTMAMETSSADYVFGKTLSFDAIPPTENGDRPSQQQQQLSWRMDPTESLSDWILQVFDRSSKQFTTYHVHKVVLCVGNRACGYFSKQQQQQQQWQQRKDSTSVPAVQLPLIRKACELIPQLLDFCYSTPDWQITRETAVGLVFLATLLDQPQLKSTAMEFVYQDLSPTTTTTATSMPTASHDEATTTLAGSVLHHYLAEASYFDQEELVEYLLELTATHLLELNSPSRLLEELSPTQFLAVLRQIPKRSSSKLSTILVDYCISHRLELTLPFVETCACLCPTLTKESSLALLELYLTLGGGSEDGYSNYDHHHHHAVAGTTTSGPNSTSNSTSNGALLNRCLQVLAEDSASLLASPEMIPQLVNQILDVCPPLLGPWMRDMLHHAHQEGSHIQTDLRQAWEQNAMMRDELAEVKRALEQVQGERQQLQKTLESTKQELRQQLDGWMSKSHRDSTEHSTRQAIWQEERDLWRIERQAWMEERGALEHELYRLKAQVTRQREIAELTKHQRRQLAKNRAESNNHCPQVQTQDILQYLSNVGMPGPGEEVSMQVSDDDSFSGELNTIDSDS